MTPNVPFTTVHAAWPMSQIERLRGVSGSTMVARAPAASWTLWKPFSYCGGALAAAGNAK